MQEGFDVVLQIFSPASESLIERRLFRMRGVFVAAPEYLDGISPILTPADLSARTACVTLLSLAQPVDLSKSSEHSEVTLVPALRSNSVHLVQEFARRAMGVAYIPTMIAYQDLLEGRLTRVLPDYETEIPFFSAVYPTSHRATAKVKLFLDLLSSTFSMEPEWDRLLGLTQGKYC